MRSRSGVRCFGVGCRGVASARIWRSTSALTPECGGIPGGVRESRRPQRSFLQAGSQLRPLAIGKKFGAGTPSRSRTCDSENTPCWYGRGLRPVASCRNRSRQGRRIVGAALPSSGRFNCPIKFHRVIRPVEASFEAHAGVYSDRRGVPIRAISGSSLASSSKPCHFFPGASRVCSRGEAQLYPREFPDVSIGGHGEGRLSSCSCQPASRAIRSTSLLSPFCIHVLRSKEKTSEALTKGTGEVELQVVNIATLIMLVSLSGASDRRARVPRGSRASRAIRFQEHRE